MSTSRYVLFELYERTYVFAIAKDKNGQEVLAGCLMLSMALDNMKAMHMPEEWRNLVWQAYRERTSNQPGEKK
jgi:hypothetical protein